MVWACIPHGPFYAIWMPKIHFSAQCHGFGLLIVLRYELVICQASY